MGGGGAGLHQKSAATSEKHSAFSHWQSACSPETVRMGESEHIRVEKQIQTDN